MKPRTKAKQQAARNNYFALQSFNSVRTNLPERIIGNHVLNTTMQRNLAINKEIQEYIKATQWQPRP
jgi:hypothetical protein